MKTFLYFIPVIFLSIGPSLSSPESKKEIQPSAFFQKRSEGWHWYKDPLREKKVEKKDRLSPKFYLRQNK